MWRWRFCDLNKLIKIQTVETVAMLKKHPKYTAETHTHTHSLNRFLLFLCSCLPFFLFYFVIHPSPVTVCLLISLFVSFLPSIPSTTSLLLALILPLVISRYAAQPFPLRHFHFPCLPLCSLLLLPLSVAALSHQFLCVCVSFSWPLSHLFSLARLSVTSCHSKLDWRDPSNPHSCH